MSESIRVMYPEEKVNAKIAELAAAISEDMKGEPVKLICILKGACFFACELAKRITVPVFIDFMSVSSYGDETESSGTVRILKDLDSSIKGENVLVVEDIIDSGRTLGYLLENLRSRGAKSVKLCTLLSKPERRVVDVPVDYVGFEIPDTFIVGYGLDYAQKYRNLPYIGIVEFD
ncbi:Hypoxanthine phosphoribosyltransferase [uncultured Roseburia sp.]|uniref:Hypoxanthine phosphoribosyltransferase n=1 Tax=Brotonthovivens ammoniilytica TaxID=2981725 RepID=A0ABT2TMM8_9FIRM|nr:hypoxanthine phosphoribosyltransferase [Brotonthovivens ammoniilytica]MCU6762916.1 hypoxanthine phosphoribosyltransferase [Brotonthovivens ammoniilytica]SCI93744.1 Hypoxanthine phosphoribosyltransferase [uncultured Roseburia sp.]